MSTWPQLRLRPSAENVACPFCRRLCADADNRTLHMETGHDLLNYLADPCWAEGNGAYLNAAMRHPEKDDILHSPGT